MGAKGSWKYLHRKEKASPSNRVSHLWSVLIKKMVHPYPWYLLFLVMDVDISAVQILFCLRSESAKCDWSSQWFDLQNLRIGRHSWFGVILTYRRPLHLAWLLRKNTGLWLGPPPGGRQANITLFGDLTLRIDILLSFFQLWFFLEWENDHFFWHPSWYPQP